MKHSKPLWKPYGQRGDSILAPLLGVSLDNDEGDKLPSSDANTGRYTIPHELVPFLDDTLRAVDVPVGYESIPPTLGFLEKILDNSRIGFSPRLNSTPAGDFPVFEGSEVTIFLDWYNAIDDSDKDNIDYFLQKFDTWAKTERRSAKRRNRQTPFFMAAACGESLQHEHYDELNILIATNKMRKGKITTEFNNNFLNSLKQRYIVSDCEDMPPDVYKEIHPGLDGCFLTEIRSVNLISPVKGKPLHLIVAGIRADHHLNGYIIPQHAVLYKIGNTKGYVSF